MSSTETRSSDSFALWFLLASGTAAGLAIISATRAKPIFIFAIGLGLMIGLIVRALAVMLHVPLTRRVVAATLLMTLVAFGGAFGLSYRRAAAEWNAWNQKMPDNPLAAALIQQHQQAELEKNPEHKQTYSIHDYLAFRFPNMSYPWPEVLFGAEWICCVASSGLCSVSRNRNSTSAP